MSEQHPRRHCQYTPISGRGDKGDSDQERHLYVPPDQGPDTYAGAPEVDIPVLIPQQIPPEAPMPGPQTPDVQLPHGVEQPRALTVQEQGTPVQARRSQRRGKGITSKNDGYHTGADYDDATVNSLGYDMGGQCVYNGTALGGSPGSAPIHPGAIEQLVRELCVMGEIVGQSREVATPDDDYYQAQQLYAIPYWRT